MNGKSDVAFQTCMTKKRGVYVESKPVEGALKNTEKTTQKNPDKAPKRPSRGQKRFLTSVLSLLSQSSRGTQFPVRKEDTPKTKKNKFTDELEHKKFDTDKRKKKYKSKVLNSHYYNPESFEVLQSKKNIILTPSVDLSNEEYDEDIKWADFLPRLVKPDNDEIDNEKERKLNYLIKEVAEGREIIDKRCNKTNEEPPTLVSENEKHSTKDPGFYNFFVDLLETTISVCNIKSEYDIQNAPSTASCNLTFEIDEAVVNKLKVVPESTCHSVQSIISMHYEDISDKNKSVDYFKTYAPLKRKQVKREQVKKKKLKSDYVFTEYSTPRTEPKTPRLVSLSASNAKKNSFYKKNSKQMLLNSLKEQLSMSNKFEEPENLYQALRVLAKNKQRAQNTIKFENVEKNPPEQVLKRRILASPSQRSRIKSQTLSKNTPARSNFCRNAAIFPKSSDFRKYSTKTTKGFDCRRITSPVFQQKQTSPTQKTPKRETDYPLISEVVYSRHSLEVYDMNYNKLRSKPKKRLILASFPRFYSPIRSSTFVDDGFTNYGTYSPVTRSTARS